MTHRVAILALALAAAGVGAGCLERADQEEMPTSVEGRMRVLEREYAARQASSEAALRSAIKEAKRLFGDDRPQAAREELKKTLATGGDVVRWAAPKSAALIEARELLHELEHALGIREGTVGMGVGRIEQDGDGIRIQETRIEAQYLLERGKSHYVSQRYAECVETMKRVLEIVRWAPADVDLTGLADQARAYLQAAEQR